MENPKVSICAVAHKVDEDLISFIDQVYAKTVSTFEVIISDNSEDCSVTSYLMSKNLDDLIVITNHQNLGLGWGMHRAFKQAKGEYILRCDVDIDIPKSWDWNLIKYLEKYPELGAIGPMNEGHGYHKKWDTKDYIETDILITYCEMIPRRTIEHMNKFYKIPLMKDIYQGYPSVFNGIELYHNYSGGYPDPNMFYGGEDFDQSLAIRYSGLRLGMAPDVFVKHKERSVNPEWSNKRAEWVGNSFRYYREKWSRILNFYDWSEMWDCLEPQILYMKRCGLEVSHESEYWKKVLSKEKK